LPLEAHLMISNLDFFRRICASRADSFLFHCEVSLSTFRVASGRSHARPRPVAAHDGESGFGREHSIHSTLPKIGRVHQMIDRIKLGCDLEADGEIDATTVPLVVAAGVDMWPGRQFSMTA